MREERAGFARTICDGYEEWVKEQFSRLSESELFSRLQKNGFPVKDVFEEYADSGTEAIAYWLDLSREQYEASCLESERSRETDERDYLRSKGRVWL